MQLKQGMSWASSYPVLRSRLSDFFRRRAPHRDPDDMVHQVFVNMVEAAGTTVANPDAYLFRVARNLLVDEHRKAAVRHVAGHIPLDQAALEQTAPEQLVDTIHPERILQGKADLEAVVSLVHDLPERTRDILLLHRLENMRQREIAQRMGLSVSTVEKHLARSAVALAHLRRSMESN